MFLLQGAESQSLVEDLRSLNPHSKAKTNKQKQKHTHTKKKTDQMNTPSENSDKGYKQNISQKRNISIYICEKLIALMREYM